MFYITRDAIANVKPTPHTPEDLPSMGMNYY